MLKDVAVKTILRAAYKNHILIPAFNIPRLPMLEPVAATLKSLDCFALIEVARLEVEKFEARSFAAVAGEFNRCADRNFTRLHQDHVPVIDEDGQRVDWQRLIQEAIDLNYDSVMIDGSRLDLAENIAIARTVATLAKNKSIAVEAELGAVLGHEAGPLPPYEELFASKRGFTRVDEAVRFVRDTGVDWLSVAVGSFHGAISGAAKDQKKPEARIDVDHLRALSEATNVPQVLHGGSGIKLDCLRQAVQNGITKINVGTTIRQAYDRKLSETGDISAAQRAVAQEMETLIVHGYQISGTASRLAKLV